MPFEPQLGPVVDAGRRVDLHPSLFTRVSATEADLRAMEEILADVLDILAEVKADQNAIHEAQGGRAKPDPTNQRRLWRRLGGALSFFGRAQFPIPGRTSMLGQVQSDELAFWKSTGRIAVAGLFLTTIFVIGLYQLLIARMN